MLVVGDVGGTHTRLAIFDDNKMVREKKYESQKFSNLSSVLQEFLKEKVACACFGLAGPVVHGRCQATNLPWIVDAQEISYKLNIGQVFLINDLEATAWGLSVLSDGQLLTLNQGLTQVGNRAIIAAGTGLGQAGIFWDGKNYHPFACEGGHVDFAPRDEREEKLLQTLRKKYGHVSYERILSGVGLTHLYEHLSGKKEKNPALITEKALKGSSQICKDVVDWFVSLYGGEAGNLALKFLARGGVYLAGGIAPKIAPILKNGLFVKAFCDKGRFESLLASIPVHVILSDDVALLGAANYAKAH